jgi:diguanylate cyclase (GGDEF)-like protein
MRMLISRLTSHFRAIEDRHSVRAQITAAVAAMAILLVGSLAAGAAFVSYNNTSALVNSKLASVASTTSDRLDRYMAVRQQEILLFSQLEPLQGLWQNDAAALSKSLDQLQRSFTDFAWIGFALPDGTVAASTGGLLRGQSVAERPWFKNGLTEASVGDVHEAKLLSSLLAQPASGEPLRFVDIALPIRTADGTVLGVFGAHLNWDWARRLVANAEDNDGDTDTTLSVISKDGTVLLGPGLGTKKYEPARIAAILNARSGAFPEVAGDNNSLTAFYVGNGYHEYQGLNWIVTASQPTSVALAAAVRSAKIILGIGAVAGLVGVIMAFFIAWRISGPIHNITLEADRIGRASGPTMLARHSGSLEVVQLTRALRSLLRRVGFAEEQTKEAEARASENAMQFKDDITKLRQLADTDYLTGLLNRRAFLAAADDAMAFSHRYGRNIATLMIDIDHFKSINDVHGHTTGDAVIKRIATIIHESIRGSDKAARFGGEEFVVLLREVNSDDAKALANRICGTIATDKSMVGGTPVAATVSIGIALNAPTDRDIQDLIERADQGLYVAKNTGRNCTFFMPVPETRPSRAA